VGRDLFYLSVMQNLGGYIFVQILGLASKTLNGFFAELIEYRSLQQNFGIK
jgi:hypothetical protein